MKIPKIKLKRSYLLIATLALALIAGAWVGLTKIEEYRAQKAQEAKEQAELLSKQQQALEKAQQEIENLKNQKPQVIIKETVKETIKEGAPQSISAQEISSYLEGVIEVQCEDSEGSGSLWNFNGNYFVLTNQHVVNPFYSSRDNKYFCYFTDSDSNHQIGAFYLEADPDAIIRWNTQTDIAVLRIVKVDAAEGYNPSIDKLDYSISELPLCEPKMSIGSPVAIVGFPAFAAKPLTTKIMTEGIISGHEGSPLLKRLPYFNYFVSAKIDSGNSGGIALSKKEGKLCILGIPTWLSVGNYETQGIIQNIHNVFYGK